VKTLSVFSCPPAPRQWGRSCRVVGTGGGGGRPKLTITYTTPSAAPEGPFSTSTETQSTSTILLSSLGNPVAKFVPGERSGGWGATLRSSAKPLFALFCLLPPARGQAPQQS